jgi:hypothetical protein
MSHASTARNHAAEASVPGAGHKSAGSGDRTTKALLACGVMAGPLFILVAGLQVATRDGFDLRRHPLSLLSLGDLGWIQIANFVVVGLLSLAFAIGMWRLLHPGRAGTWGPLLVGVFGLGLLVGGIFVADPDLGFPPGVPAASEPSWHGIVHNIGPGVAFDALVLASLVVMRRFLGLRQRAWAAYCAATAVTLLALTWWPSLAGISVRLAVAIVVGFVWVSALAGRLIRELSAS